MNRMRPSLLGLVLVATPLLLTPLTLSGCRDEVSRGSEGGLGGIGGANPLIPTGGTGGAESSTGGGAEFSTGGNAEQTTFRYYDFSSVDARGADTGDFSPGHFKGECSSGRGATGLALDTKCGSPTILECEKGLAVGPPTASVSPYCKDDRRDTTTLDWDPGFFKGECGANEAIVGLSRDGDGSVYDVLCAASGKTSAGACTVRNATGGDNRGRADTGDWAEGATKVECAAGEFVKGVSLTPETRKPHALLCCSGVGPTNVSAATNPDQGDFRFACRSAGESRHVEPFLQSHLHGGKRYVYANAAFPEGGSYEKVTLSFTLSCPGGGCDPWDRWGSLGIVMKKGDTADHDELLELARFVTPYGVGGTFTYDLTDLRPLLRGNVELRLFIDTWVDGWLATADFDFKGGYPKREAVFVQSLWSNPHVGVGNPSDPVKNRVPERTLTVPESVCGLGVRGIITGHGQGNSSNCAEFCPKKHAFSLEGHAHESLVWRNDCATTAVPNQNGTWQYDRAGWCPGAAVRTLDVNGSGDVSRAQLAGKESLHVSYDFEGYDNQCRPDNCIASSCVFDTGCGYNGGSHTEPFYSLTAVLVGYR